jgi:hypothetical protein
VKIGPDSLNAELRRTPSNLTDIHLFRARWNQGEHLHHEGCVHDAVYHVAHPMNVPDKTPDPWFQSLTEEVLLLARGARQAEKRKARAAPTKQCHLGGHFPHRDRLMGHLATGISISGFTRLGGLARSRPCNLKENVSPAF